MFLIIGVTVSLYIYGFYKLKSENVDNSDHSKLFKLETTPQTYFFHPTCPCIR